MAKQLMFYEQVVGVSPQRHGNWSVDRVTDHNFAKDANSVPVVTVEMSTAAREFAVVFAEAGGEELVPFVVLGVENCGNVYVTNEGAWDAKYQPAFVRRYPFIVSGTADADKYVLCIDESWEGCNQEGRGERLFDDQGNQTPVLNGVVDFHEQFQKHAERTRQFCTKLNDLNLLESVSVTLTVAGGEKVVLGGFMIVKREKLRDLPADTLNEMNENGELDLIFAHLISLNNFANLAQRISKRLESEPATPNSQPEKDGSEPAVNDVEGIAP